MLKKFAVGVLASALLAFGLAGCTAGAGSSEPEQIDYADDEAMAVIASGWNERSALLDGLTSEDPEYVTKLRTGVQAEIDKDAPLKSRQFEDSVLQEKVIAYLNSLDGQMAVLDNYSMNDLEFYVAWKAASDERSVLLKSFVEDYGMTVDPKYKVHMDDIVASGTAVENKDAQDEALNEMVSTMSWEPDPQFNHEYVAVAENTSEYDLENVSLLVSFYDSDGVKTESYAGVNSWKKGEKVKFEAYCDSDDVQRIETVMQFYNVAK